MVLVFDWGGDELVDDLGIPSRADSPEGMVLVLFVPVTSLWMIVGSRHEQVRRSGWFLYLIR